MDNIILKIKVKRDDKECEALRDEGMFFENIADALNIARSQIVELDDKPFPLPAIYQKLGEAIRNLKNNLEAGEVKNCVEFIIDELAYALESDPAFNENDLRNAIYKNQQQPKRTATRPELIDRLPLLKKLANNIKQALADCWEYHAHLIKETAGGNIKKSELLDYLYDVELTDWEDVGFFVGYLRGIDDGVELLSEAKPYKEKLSAKTINQIKSTQKLLKKKLAGK